MAGVTAGHKAWGKGQRHAKKGGWLNMDGCDSALDPITHALQGMLGSRDLRNGGAQPSQHTRAQNHDPATPQLTPAPPPPSHNTHTTAHLLQHLRSTITSPCVSPSHSAYSVETTALFRVPQSVSPRLVTINCTIAALARNPNHHHYLNRATQASPRKRASPFSQSVIATLQPLSSHTLRVAPQQRDTHTSPPIALRDPSTHIRPPPSQPPPFSACLRPSPHAS